MRSSRRPSTASESQGVSSSRSPASPRRSPVPTCRRSPSSTRSSSRRSRSTGSSRRRTTRRADVASDDRRHAPLATRSTGALVSILGPAPQAPAIAIIDSGVNAADSRTSVRASLRPSDLCSLCTDGPTGPTSRVTARWSPVSRRARAHSIRASRANAPIVSIRVANAERRVDGERRHRGVRLDPRERGAIRHQGRQLLDGGRVADELPLRPARPGGRAVLVPGHHRRRGRGQLRHGQCRRHVGRSRQRPVRHHGRRSRPARNVGSVGRHDRSVVGIRFHGRRLLEARHRRAGPLHDHACPDATRQSREPCPSASSRRLHVDVRNVVLVSDGRRCGGSDPRPASRLGPGRGQGRADADLELSPRSRRAGRRCRRGQRGSAANLDFTPAEPERRLDVFVTQDPTTGAECSTRRPGQAPCSNELHGPRRPGASAAWASAAWARRPGQARHGARPR